MRMKVTSEHHIRAQCEGGGIKLKYASRRCVVNLGGGQDFAGKIGGHNKSKLCTATWFFRKNIEISNQSLQTQSPINSDLKWDYQRAHWRYIICSLCIVGPKCLNSSTWLGVLLLSILFISQRMGGTLTVTTTISLKYLCRLGMKYEKLWWRLS